MHRDKIFGPSGRLVELGPDHANLVPLAQDVAIQRAVCVVEALFLIGAIRNLQGASGSARAVVQCVAAHVQSCSAQYGQQAAHLLPGQILINSQPVWLLATTQQSSLASEVVRLKQQTMMCFAATNVLPALVNRADSEAEGTGAGTATEALKPLFGQVVQELWHTARARAERPLSVDRDAVFNALQRWFSQISPVYSEAAGRKAERKRLDEARVLSTYADSFRVANVARFVMAHAPQIYQRYA
jgi:hypothetical protein